MFRESYNPYDKKMLINIDPMAVSVTVSVYFVSSMPFCLDAFSMSLVAMNLLA